MFGKEQTYYDVLELTPDATLQEIKTSYFRLKEAYSKDSVALYTLVSGEETAQIIDKVEEAYIVLSNPERRQEYDRRFDQQKPQQKIISIDRTPPMAKQAHSDDILVPPTTEFKVKTDVKILEDITHEHEWRGGTLKKIREAMGITIEDVALQTRVSKTYLRAIEDELYEKLPAPVFVRGFIIQYAKLMKLPSEEVSSAYMRRFNASKVSK